MPEGTKIDIIKLNLVNCPLKKELVTIALCDGCEYSETIGTEHVTCLFETDEP